jgi:hypothetical protein
MLSCSPQYCSQPKIYQFEKTGRGFNLEAILTDCSDWEIILHAFFVIESAFRPSSEKRLLTGLTDEGRKIIKVAETL